MQFDEEDNFTGLKDKYYMNVQENAASEIASTSSSRPSC
ncbi:unnamed protein product, partial [Callosobruchus maculatus]